MKLTWVQCPCGHPGCTREYPSNIGVFYTGSGFSPSEKELIEEAFAALRAKKQDEKFLITGDRPKPKVAHYHVFTPFVGRKGIDKHCRICFLEKEIGLHYPDDSTP